MLPSITPINPRSNSIPDPKCYPAPNNLNTGHEDTERLFLHRAEGDQQEIKDSHIGSRPDDSLFIFVQSYEAEECKDLEDETGLGRWGDLECC